MPTRNDYALHITHMSESGTLTHCSVHEHIVSSDVAQLSACVCHNSHHGIPHNARAAQTLSHWLRVECHTMCVFAWPSTGIIVAQTNSIKTQHHARVRISGVLRTKCGQRKTEGDKNRTYTDNRALVFSIIAIHYGNGTPERTFEFESFCAVRAMCALMMVIACAEWLLAFFRSFVYVVCIMCFIHPTGIES